MVPFDRAYIAVDLQNYFRGRCAGVGAGDNVNEACVLFNLSVRTCAGVPGF